MWRRSKLSFGRKTTCRNEANLSLFDFLQWFEQLNVLEDFACYNRNPPIRQTVTKPWSIQHIAIFILGLKTSQNTWHFIISIVKSTFCTNVIYQLKNLLHAAMETTTYNTEPVRFICDETYANASTLTFYHIDCQIYILHKCNFIKWRMF